VDIGVPAAKTSFCILDLATVVPGFALPIFLLADRHEIQKAAAGHKIMHEMSAGTHPVRRVVPKVEMRHPIGWREAAIGHIAGKSRMFITEQDFSDHRVNSICADDDVAVDDGSVVKDGPRAIFGLNRVDATATCVDPICRQRIDQDR